MAPVDPSNPAPAPQRPEGLPDAFWDEKVGVRTNELLADYNALAADRAKNAEAFKAFPEKVEDAGKFYTLPEQLFPEGVKLPEGAEFTPNQDLLNAALPILHKHRIAPDAFHDLVRAFNGQQVAAFAAATAADAEDAKKLGANGPARRKAVGDWIAAMAPEKAGFIDPNAITSGFVEFFEAIIAKATNGGNVVPLTPKAGNEPPAPAPQTTAERWYPNMQKKVS